MNDLIMIKEFCYLTKDEIIGNERMKKLPCAPLRLYLAGPMRGIKEWNFPAFHRASRVLRSLGYTVFNPAEADIERCGGDISAGNTSGNECAIPKKFNFKLEEALHADLTYICKEAQAIALLPGWEKSTGVAAELTTARALNKPVYLYPQDFC